MYWYLSMQTVWVVFVHVLRYEVMKFQPPSRHNGGECKEKYRKSTESSLFIGTIFSVESSSSVSIEVCGDTAYVKRCAAGVQAATLRGRYGELSAVRDTTPMVPNHRQSEGSWNDGIGEETHFFDALPQLCLFFWLLSNHLFFLWNTEQPFNL